MAYITQTFSLIAFEAEENESQQWEDTGFKDSSNRKRFVAIKEGALVKLSSGGGKDETLYFDKGARILVGESSIAYVEDEILTAEELTARKNKRKASKIK